MNEEVIFTESTFSTGISYGKIITEHGYKGGVMVNSVQKTIESLPVANRQQLIDRIFDQLAKLKDQDEVCFTVYPDKHTREPYRIDVSSQTRL